MTLPFDNCPHRDRLTARSCDMEQLYQGPQIDALSWEDRVTTKADPAVTAIPKKVIQDFAQQTSQRMKSRLLTHLKEACALLELVISVCNLPCFQICDSISTASE